MVCLGEGAEKEDISPDRQRSEMPDKVDKDAGCVSPRHWNATGNGSESVVENRQNHDEKKGQEMNFKGKIAILPCTGVGQVVGTIARQAGYRVCDDLRPDQTVLLCLPALVKGVCEDLEMIAQCPVIVIEGCQEKCATHALGMREVAPAAVVSVLDAMSDRGLKVRRESRRCLSETELAVADIVGEQVVGEVDRLLRETGHATR